MLNRKCGLWKLIVICFVVSLFPAPGKAQDSVADAARKNHSTTPVAKTQESASEYLRMLRFMDKEEHGKAVLKRANAPNVGFSEGKEWVSTRPFQTLFILHLANAFVLSICFFSLGIKNPWKWFQQTRMKNMMKMAA
jgi:hypothetical protein